MAPRDASRTLLVALLVGAVLTPAIAGSAAASPRPVAVCEPCDRGFVSAAHGHGVDVRIERSTVTMRVHRNGSATWTVENRLNDSAAAKFSGNDSLRRSVAAEAVSIHDGRLLSTGVDGDTLRIRYRTADAATRAPGGVLRVEAFRDEAGLRTYTGLGADRLTLVAPDGMTVGHALPGAEVSGRRMTATSFDPAGDGPFVTLVPADALLGPLRSLVAVALPLAGVVGRNLLLLVAVPTAVFAGGLRALAWVVDRVDLGGSNVPDRRALAVVGLGLLALAHPLYESVVAGTTPPLFAGGVGAVALGGALSVPRVRDRLSTARVAGVVALAFAVAVVAGYALRALPLGDPSIRADANVVRLVLPVLPLYVVTLVGYAAAHVGLRRALVAAAGALALVLVTTFSIASQGGTLYFLGVVVGVLGAVAGVVVGAPFFLLGHGLPGPADRGGRGGDAGAPDGRPADAD